MKRICLNKNSNYTRRYLNKIIPRTLKSDEILAANMKASQGAITAKLLPILLKYLKPRVIFKVEI